MIIAKCKECGKLLWKGNKDDRKARMTAIIMHYAKKHPKKLMKVIKEENSKKVEMKEAKPSNPCPECGFDMADYSDYMECNACGYKIKPFSEEWKM